MKKSLFILAAASAVAFAACNGGNNEGSYTKEQADSMAQARIDSTQAALKLQNDSLMQAQAIKTADSIRIADSLFAAGKASSTKTTVVRKTTSGGKTTTHTKTEEVTTAPTVTAPSSTDKKAARFNDEAAKAKVEQASTDAKAARFKKPANQ